jgi:murein DD-endopeptidase MepM/ murein hydrolase activator NlpD
MPFSRPTGSGRPSRTAGPLAVTAVGGFLAVVIGTGHAPAAVRTVAASAPASVSAGATTVGMSAGMSAQTVSARQVATAMRALADPHGSVPNRRPASAHHASRSHQRAPLHTWVRPNYGPLTSPFGYRWGRLHAGLDLAGPYGSPILAATDGCISYAGPESGYGEVMKITDWDGTETVYGHMSAFVRTTGCVKAGEVIARVGAAGDATGAHLHFEVHVGGVPIDPRPFLAKRGVAI